MTQSYSVQPGHFMLMPPAPDLCQCCAVKHEHEMPHDATSLFYGFWFSQQFGRSPTWNDALSHCPDSIKQRWLEMLFFVGIDPNSTKVLGGLKSNQELMQRLSEYDSQRDGTDDESC